jgi:hypothetical protein
LREAGLWFELGLSSKKNFHANLFRFNEGVLPQIYLICVGKILFFQKTQLRPANLFDLREFVETPNFGVKKLSETTSRQILGVDTKCFLQKMFCSRNNEVSC